MAVKTFDIDPLDHPNCYQGLQYALDVRKNPQDYCESIKWAVDRFFKDIERAKGDSCTFSVDLGPAERFLRLVQRMKHAKGVWKSPFILYEPWQKFKFMNLFMFTDKRTGKRRFRSAYCGVPRGSGKSAEASQIGLYFLALDGENGPEVVCASTKKDAARIVFDSSRVMALSNKGFIKSTGTRVLAHTITHPKSNGIMKPLSSDPKSQDGLNPSLIIGDEIHEWNRGLYDVLDSAMSKRNDSLFFMISTAGFNTEGIGHEIYAYTMKVMKGEVEDDTWFGNIYEADEEDAQGDNWLKPEVWKKANPNWGISVDPVNFEAKAKKAKETPASKNNFLVKHLNIWTNQASPYFSIDHWDRLEDKTLTLEQYKNKKCYVGLDVGAKVDLCSVFMVFRDDDGKFVLFDKSYIPEVKVDDPRNASYRRWVDESWLYSHDGEVIDFSKLEEDIISLSKEHRFIDTLFDPWSAYATAQNLEKARLNVTEFRMTVANLSEAMKTLDAWIREGKIRHNGSPLIRWCLGNVVAKEDANGNVFPRKEHDRLKIDVAVALIIAIAGWVKELENTSIYETRGLRVL